jgi:hypothetical protein
MRQGKFKKASNMNFALNVSVKVERLLQQLVNEYTSSEEGDQGYLTVEEEEELYNKALNQVLAGDPRAKAGGNVRIGEVILIVDSDTQVVRCPNCGLHLNSNSSPA